MKNSNIQIERILDLPFGELKKKKNTPEVKALRKIIETFPFILDVAENNFGSEYAKMALIKNMFERLNVEQLLEIFKEKNNEND